jgi:hypothetical protein
MATSPTEDIGGLRWQRWRQQRVCNMRFQETILGRLGKTMHVQMDDITHEPLPRRWVELILYLEEEERMRAEREPKPEPQRL